MRLKDRRHLRCNVQDDTDVRSVVNAFSFYHPMGDQGIIWQIWVLGLAFAIIASEGDRTEFDNGVASALIPLADVFENVCNGSIEEPNEGMFLHRHSETYAD